MKALISTLRLSLILLMSGVTSLHAQWNTLTHDATNNRSIRDVFFISSTGYAAGWRADAVPWGTRGLLYKTTDGGQTWNFINIPLAIGADSVIGFNNVHFTTPSQGYASASCYTTNGSVGLYYGAIVKTTDGGATWTPCFSSKAQVNYATTYTISFNHIFFDNLYHGTISASKQTGPTAYDGVMYTTNNSGNTWNAQVTAYTGAAANASFFSNSSVGSVAGGRLMWLSPPFNGKIARSTDGGNSWNTTFTDNDYSYIDIQFPSAQIGYAVGDSMYNTFIGGCKGKLVKTTDGGQSWSAMAYFPNFKPYCVYFITDLEGYIGGETAAGNSGLLKTTDGGLTWTTEVYPDIAMNSLITSIAFSTPVTGYAANSYTNSNSIYGNFTQSCGVYLGPDTTFCQAQGQLFATPATPGNDYVFDWTPGTGLSDSTAQSPLVDHVHNQQYIVTMTDTVTNCVAVDTIVVSAYNMITGPRYVCPPDSTLLDFGPGAAYYLWQNFTDTNNVTTFINVGSQTLWASEPGSYLGYATFPGCGALTSLVTVVDSCAAPFACAVDAGPDTTFCQQQGQLFATPASPGNYTFTWSPSTGLDNPFAQNPHVISGVNNQQYVVTMSDSAAGCTATDTVIVSAYYFLNETIYSCNNQPVTIDLGPGGVNYTYSFTDTASVSHSGTMPNQYFIATQPAQYLFIAAFPGCGALTSLVTVVDSCNVAVGNVWPGDCNYDLSANMADALHIGLAYGATGATRPNATNGWYAQPMTDWTQNYANCNYKHGDADGNGTIDVNDTVPISLNYGNTHPFRLAPAVAPASAPQLYLVANYDTVGLQTLVTVDVRLGTSAFPIDSLYGISFRLTADAGLIDTTLTMINLNTTWLGTTGTDMFGFRKHFRSNGSVDCAESKNNHINTLNGNGTIGTFLIVTTDNLSGIAICHIDVTDVTAVTASQQYLTLATVNDSVVIDPSVPAGIPPTELAPVFSVYPNPANNVITVQTSVTATQIEITDMLGRVITTIAPSSLYTSIDAAAFADGVYLLRVHNGNAVTTQKLSVSH